MKHLFLVISIISCAAFAQDPTAPAPKMADAMKTSIVDSPVFKLRALVVGAEKEGVAYLGNSDTFTPVRAAHRFTHTVDGVNVTITIKSVTERGVELETMAKDAGKIFLPGSYKPLSMPTNAPSEFVRYLEASEVPLDALLRLIADQTGANISSSEATNKKNISIFLRNVTAATAVEEICRAANLWYHRDEGGVIRVTTMEEYTQNLTTFREEKTEMFTLLYPNVIEVAAAIYGIHPDRTLLSLGEEDIQDDDEDDLARRFRRFRVLEDNGGSQFMDIEPPNATSSGAGTGAGTFSFSRGSGLSHISQWEQLRERMRRNANDTRLNALSANEAKALNAARQAGDTNTFEVARSQATLVQANIFVTISRRNNILIVRTSDMRVMDEIRALVKKLDVPTPMVLMEVKVLELTIDDDFKAGVRWSLNREHSDQFSAKTLTGTYDAAASIAQTLAGGGTAFNPSFAFAYLSHRVSTDIELLQKDGKIKTLATPTLLTANNEVSRIFSGKEYPLVTGWTKSETTTSDGVVVQGYPTVQLERKDVGTMLLITPNINADRTVTLRLLQENSSVSDERVSIPVTGGIGESKDIEFVESRSLTGTFVAQDGMAVIAGGLITEHEEEQYWRTPVLGSMPLLGWLFRGTEKVKKRTELVVLIRPHVISTPMEGGKISRELMEKLSAHPARDGKASMEIHKPIPGERTPHSDIKQVIFEQE